MTGRVAVASFVSLLNLDPAPVFAWASGRYRPAEVCCRLEADGWANPSREEMERRGSFAVHHWVHTWLDGPDARWAPDAITMQSASLKSESLRYSTSRATPTNHRVP